MPSQDRWDAIAIKQKQFQPLTPNERLWPTKTKKILRNTRAQKQRMKPKTHQFWVNFEGQIIDLDNRQNGICLYIGRAWFRTDEKTTKRSGLHIVHMVLGIDPFEFHWSELKVVFRGRISFIAHSRLLPTFRFQEMKPRFAHSNRVHCHCWLWSWYS